MQNKPLVQLQDVTKDFFVKIQEIKVLRGISLDIFPGELVVILGPSGSGKSTLLNLILGLEPPSTGKVIFKGEEVQDKDADYMAEIRKQNIGMVHQQANWIRSLNVIENVSFPLVLRNLPKHQVMSKAMEKLQLFGMDGWANFSPSELSSGQQQKVGLARALVTDPDIIVADEPTGNLDYKSGKYLVELLAGLVKSGKTVIMVTHDLEYIEYADRIIRILDGKIYEEINNKKNKHDIADLKKKIVSQNMEAENLYIAEKENAPESSKKESRIHRIKNSIKGFSFKKLLKKILNSYHFFIEVFDVLITLIFVMMSLSYRVVNRILEFGFWPSFVGNIQYRVSNSYYAITNKLMFRKNESVNFADMIDLSFKNLLSKKTRTYVTIGGVALGIAFTVFLVSIGFGLERLVLQNFNELDQLRSVDVYSSISQNLIINDETVNDLEGIAGVESIMPVIAIAGKITLQGSDTDIVAYGVNRQYLDKSDLTLNSGDFFSESLNTSVNVKGDEDIVLAQEPQAETLVTPTTEEEASRNVKKIQVQQTGDRSAIVNQAFLDLFSLDSDKAIGQNFEVTLVATQEAGAGDDIELESYPITYDIAGIISNFNNPVIYLPLQDVKSLGVDSYSQIRLLSDSKEQVPEIRQKIDVLGFRTESVLDTVTSIEETFRNVRFVLTSVGMVALAVASFGMFNTLTVSLLERIREVGLLKVMGMKSAEIKDLFLTESILLGLGGGIAGILLGLVFGTFVSTMISSVAISRGYESISIASIPWPSLLGILAVATITGILTGLYPSKRATKISALNALRYE